jgi:hypothetical protein
MPDLRGAILRTVAETKGKVAREKPKVEILLEGQIPNDLKRPPAPLPTAPAEKVPPRYQKKEQRTAAGIYAVWEDGIERNVSESWYKLLMSNDLRCWTDAVLLQKMEALFEDRLSPFFRDVKRVRSAYNRGALPGMKGLPAWKSTRYERRGGKVYKVTARGTVLQMVKGVRGRVQPRLSPPPKKDRE